jgi:iron complex transport system ATP-binding protein
VIKDLLDAGYAPSAGVLNVLDSDFETARDLHIPIVSEIPFAQVSDEAYSDNLRNIDSSEAVILTDFPVGPGNMRNIEAARRALDSGKTVILLNPHTVEERDFVGGKAMYAIDGLLNSGAIVAGNRSDIVKLLKERL